MRRAPGTIPVRDRSHSSRGGFILVAALWILVALAVLASIASFYVAQSATALTVNDDAIESDAVITAGIELTAYRLSGVNMKKPTHGGFRFRLDGTDVAVEFLSESARINLNMASKTFIAGLFTVLGAQPEMADQYADHVVKWRSAPKANRQDEEDMLYRAAGLGYFPRRSPFNHVGELWLVLGLPPALVERALPHVTLFSGMRDVNVLDAAPEVIAALPGMTPARLDAFLSQRESPSSDPQLLLQSLGDEHPGATLEGSMAYRVRMLIASPGRQEKTAEVVIMLMTQGNEPYRVLSWQDDIDLNTGGPRSPAEAR